MSNFRFAGDPSLGAYCGRGSVLMMKLNHHRGRGERFSDYGDAVTQLIHRSEITFGEIDAKNALVTRDKAARRLFLDAFVLPSSVDMDAILRGDRFLIYGAKGSGKTALLRYVMEDQEKKKNASKFIIFNEDITDQEFEKIGDKIDFDTVLKPDIADSINVRSMWDIFIIGKICDMLSNRTDIFDDVSKSNKLKNIIADALDYKSKTALERLLNKIKSGTIRLSAGAKEYAELEAVINFENDDGTVEINYSLFADVITDKICNFIFAEDVRFNLFIDELNLAMLAQKQHKKDSILIRDLIISVGRLNRIFTEKNVPIYIYAAVRVEVAKALNASRNEIDKYLIDKGQLMQWHDGFEIERYPIFEIIEQRISVIESNSVGKCNDASTIWSSYFNRDIFNISPKKFISEVTWCNPRDIVNLFNLASKSQMSRPRYDTDVFAGIAHQYSELVWSERAEELNADHSMTVVNNIKKLMSGYYNHFNIGTLTKHAENVSQSNQVVAQMLNTIGIERICRDMYYVGILGQVVINRYRRDNFNRKIPEDIHAVWFYRDNIEFDNKKWMIVHRALLPCFQMGAWRADMFGLDSRIS